MTVMIGIDPHKASHTAVAIGSDEVVLDELKVRSSTVQAQRLGEWAARFDQREWAVESAFGLGYLVSQQLVGAGETVFDVPATLASRVRVLSTGRSNKNDPNDARSVAVAALRSDRLTAVGPDDHTTVLRLLAKRHRDMARTRAVACGRLHALLLELAAGGIATEISTYKAQRVLDGVTVGDEASRYRVLICGELIADIARLDTALKASKKRTATAVSASGTTVCEIFGIGPICAAIIIGHVGNIDRFATRGHFASYNATAPIEASSGNKTRHRLNPRGNRQLNNAIHIAAIAQLRHNSEGRVYYDRKRAEGKTGKEAIRALKRQLSDVIWRHLVADAQRTRCT